MVRGVDCGDPTQHVSRLLPYEEVLECRTVVLDHGGEEAEALIAHYEEMIEILTKASYGSDES